MSRLEEYFKDPQAFVPERWLKSDAEYRNTNPYLVLPFGHGPRTCIARRLAEQNMQVLILKVRNLFYMTCPLFVYLENKIGRRLFCVLIFSDMQEFRNSLERKKAGFEITPHK